MLAHGAVHLLAAGGGSKLAAARAAARVLAPHVPYKSSRSPALQPCNTRTMASADDAPETEQKPVQVFTSFRVYKGRGAVQIQPVKPKWTPTTKGDWLLEKEGGMMFEVAASLGEKRYDWSNKVQICLNPLELAEIVTDPKEERTFYHDTFKGQPGREGTKTKTFKWSAAPDNKNYFINARMVDKTDGPEKSVNASVSLSAAEFFCFKQLVSSCMASFYGFDVAVQGQM